MGLGRQGDGEAVPEIPWGRGERIGEFAEVPYGRYRRVFLDRTDCDQLRPTRKSGEISMAYPNLKQSIWLLVFFVLGQLVLAALENIVGLWQPGEGFVSGFSLLVGFLAILSYVYRRTDLDWEYFRELFNTGFNWRVWPCVAISIVGMVFFQIGLIGALSPIVPVSEWLQDVNSEQTERNTFFWSAFFTIVVVAPLVEETLFRGIILNGLAAYHTRTRAIVWSAVLFSVFHLEPMKLVPIFLSGLVLAWWVVRTGSLWPVLFGHALNNFISVAAEHADVPESTASQDPGDLTFIALWISVAGIALTVLGLWWFHRISNNERRVSEGQELPADAGADTA